MPTGILRDDDGEVVNAEAGVTDDTAMNASTTSTREVQDSNNSATQHESAADEDNNDDDDNGDDDDDDDDDKAQNPCFRRSTPPSLPIRRLRFRDPPTEYRAKEESHMARTTNVSILP